MMVAKGIGGGFPIGAVLATEEAASGMTTGTHGSTYGGNPLGCAVGSAVLEHVATPAFLSDVNRKARLMRQGLEGLVVQFPNVFGGVTGSGLMLGLKCRANNIDVVNAGYVAEVLTVPAAENVVRILPALNILDDDIKAALLRLEAAALIVQSAK
jgi:acetylornithine/N-succinyldiaminopimelate aminotransferase